VPLLERRSVNFDSLLGVLEERDFDLERDLDLERLRKTVGLLRDRDLDLDRDRDRDRIDIFFEKTTVSVFFYLFIN
jgi:hypothetical protein